MIRDTTRTLLAGLLLACLATGALATEVQNNDAPTPIAADAEPDGAPQAPPAAEPMTVEAESEAPTTPDPEAMSEPQPPGHEAARGGDAAPAPEAVNAVGPTLPPFELLGAQVPPGDRATLPWSSGQNSSGLDNRAQVLVAHGSRPGKVLCVMGAIHGDEINGVEIARRVFYRTDPAQLAGTLVVVPIVNLYGFEQGYRYLSDRRDLNRHFPGRARGSSASRIAHSFFNKIVRRCNALVDLHTGSFHRTNLPQLRADLRDPSVAHLTQGFGATAVVNDVGPAGSLRQAASGVGIPAVTFEIGEPMRLHVDEIRHGAKALRSLMAFLGMAPEAWHWDAPQPRYHDSFWVRTTRGGILLAAVGLGDTVNAGQVLGVVTDPINNRRNAVTAPQAGRVLGMAVNQVTRPGYAVFRIGVETPPPDAQMAPPGVEQTAETPTPPELSAPAPSDEESPTQEPLASE
ncbi:MAG: succinylglutamate desuccinylase/aspartoacylase family protein [Pseudomonadota bacterium]